MLTVTPSSFRITQMKSLGFRIAVRMATSHAFALGSRAAIASTLAALAGLHILPASAQQIPMRPGEAFVTHFSGTTNIPGPGGAAVTVINPGGVVGSIVDLRNPNQPPQGQHWIGEPQRMFVTAAEVGQVFGVAIDDAPAPNIYLSATAAFGLHRAPGNTQWQNGMWGAGGGPGTIYRIGPATNYRPQPFAQVTLGGRPNSGAALGNIAYDRWNRQLYVTDMETGMIHRIRAADGVDLGFYDHGTRGRSNFLDVSTGQQSSLPPVPFNSAPQARIADCPSARFDNSPECWNLAPNGRRVWGIGVWRNGQTGEVRLYYAAWSAPTFDPEGWLALDDSDKRNTVWSVGIGGDGSFTVGSIRREFILPDFFVNTTDIARAGFSQPVSDISFPSTPGMPLMLVAERGGMRNLGLGEQDPFATPHEARVLRYELHQDGVWRPIGRYEVGFYDRANEGEPRMRANSAGGAAFGHGYSNRWTVNASQPDNYVWITGDSLCSPDGPCNLAASGDDESGDDSEVHGVQGLREDFYGEVAPASAYGLAPEQQIASGQTSVIGPDEAYLIDININMTPAGAPIIEEFVRNDATTVGDIAIFQQMVVQAAGVVYPLPPAPPVLIAEPGHDPNYSHARYGSHGQQQSHYRFASHWPAMSHNRYGSHNLYWSHYQYASHNLQWSHNRYGSHSTKQTHNKLGSHQPIASHFAKASKIHILAASHKQFGSHNLKQSLNDKLKLPDPKPIHTLAKSAFDKGIKIPDPKHSVIKSSLDKDLKFVPPPPHSVAKSVADKSLKIPEPVPVHTVAKSAFDKNLKVPEKHNPVQSAIEGSKLKAPEPKAPEPKHNPVQSAIKDGKLKIEPKGIEPKHDPVQSAIKDGKLKIDPKGIEPKHSPAQSAVQDSKLKAIEPKHDPVASNIKLKGPEPKHDPVQSAIKDGKLKIEPRGIEPKHSPAASAAADAKLKQKTIEPVHAPANSAKLQIQQPKGPLPGPKDSGPAKDQPKVLPKVIVPETKTLPKAETPAVKQLQTPPQPKVQIQTQPQVKQTPPPQQPKVQIQTQPQVQQLKQTPPPQPKVQTPPPVKQPPPKPKHNTDASAKEDAKKK
jgi:hypothetical protein